MSTDRTPDQPVATRRWSASMIAMTVTIAVIGIGILVAIVATLASQTSATRIDTETGTGDGSGEGATSTDIALVEADSHVLNQGPEGAPVLVEFLDFECEACAAFYPYVEELRETYGEEFTYVVRYFPIPGHSNSMTSALAVEAAAQQGQFEAMYEKMYETQAEWGEQQESKADVFRGYAEDLGLDMQAYDRAISDEATVERVQKDFTAGQELGVTGTPTFFLDGTMLEMREFTDLEDALRSAIEN